MTVEPAVFLDLIIAIFILAATLIIIAVAYAKMLTRLHTLQKEEGELEREIQGEESQIKTFQSQEEQQARAAVGKQIQNISKQQKEELEKISSEFLDAFRQGLQAVREEHLKRIKSISDTIETDALSEVKDFKQVLQKETVASQKIVEQKIEEEYKAAQGEISAYKGEQLKKIDSSIYDMLQVVAKEVLGKTLSLGEHEALVNEALEKAKTEGVLKRTVQ